MASLDSKLPKKIGRYRVERLVGKGAMGHVLLAHDPVLDRNVAVKLLRNDLDLPPDQRTALLDRMRQEARASARVSHPNIVALHDMGEDPDKGLYLVFEFLAGDTLRRRLERGPLGPNAAAALAREIGGALATAHSAGVLHRDIKPDNIVLSPYGAKVTDFGIARLPDSTLTLGGGLLGTPAYSAPEALSGGKFSPQSDQFSMAAMLYEAMSGRRAFPGDDAVAVANRITTEEPPRIAAACGLDPHVDNVLAKGLAKSPRARYETCDEFGRALAEALEMSPRSAMPTLPDQHHIDTLHGEAPAGRKTRIAVGGAAVGALLTIAAFQLTSQLRRPEPAEPGGAPSVATWVGATEAMPVAWLAEKPSEPKALPKKRRRIRKKVRSAVGPSKQDAGSLAQATKDASPGEEDKRSKLDAADGNAQNEDPL